MPRTAVLEVPSAGATAAASGVEESARVALAGLVAYQEAVHRGVAERLGVRVEGVEVLVVTAGAGEVRFDVRLSGPESTESYDAVRAIVEAHAPVVDLVTGA